MSTRFEYYIVDDSGGASIYNAEWVAMTFTPSEAHKITSVKLLLYKQGSPGDLTVSIQGISAGAPDGSDLCSGSTNGNTLPTSSPYEWREITLGAGYDLGADTMYAIVVRAPVGSESNRGIWRVDVSGGTYTRGNGQLSSNSGVDWDTGQNWDMMFEDWGEAIPEVEPAAVDVGIASSAERSLKLARESSVDVGIAPSADRRCIYHRYGWRP